VRVIGKRVTTDNIEVSIDTREVLNNIYTHSVPQGLAFLSKDGFWYKETGYDYHRRDEIYEQARQATDEELEFLKAYKLLRKYVKENDL
jgi:hypothetical protein